MNEEPTLYENLRRTQHKLVENKKQEGVKIEYKDNWQGENEPFIEYHGEMYSSSGIIKLMMALSLPRDNFKKMVKSLENEGNENDKL